MSAWPDDPDHFCRWLDERAVTPVESFAPRLAYGRYLQEQLAVANVRIGRVIEFDLEATTREAAEAEVKAMCDKLLANTVIEGYRAEVA